MTTDKNSKKTPTFYCETCDFKCYKHNEFKRHIETIKHKRLHDATIKTLTDEPKIFSCVCGKKYKHHPSLAKHKRTCIAINTSADAPEDSPLVIEVTEKEEHVIQEDDIICKDDKVTITKEMFLTLIKNSEEMMYKNFNSLPPIFKNGHL